MTHFVNEDKFDELLDQILNVLDEKYESIDVEDLDIKQPFFELGFSSSQIFSLKEDLSQITGLTLSPMVFFDYPNLESLINFILFNYH